MPKLWRWKSVESSSIVKKSDLSHSLWKHSFFIFENFTDLNRTVTCIRPTAGVHLAPCHDEFRGPRSVSVNQVALATTTTTNLSKLIGLPLVWRGSLEKGCQLKR
ncbi:hypothetical protein TNCV_1887161 [Trichonephila clavipes]|nr:hypothetical protein TNCV_1887161 [Trichonephila clavipes]